MSRRYIGATIVMLAAHTLLASTAPSSIAAAVELKGNQKKQRLLVPAVQMVREKAARSTRRGNVKGNRTITVGGSRTE
jgi:hypothetical protein